MLSIILTNWVTQILLVLAAIGSLVWLFAWLFGDNPKVLATIPGIVLILAVIGFFYGQTHRLVEPNRVMLVIDRTSGQAIPPLMRPAGITNVPLWTSLAYDYPAQTELQYCPTFTPSAKGGTSLTTIFCFTLDASKINWYTQFKAFNGDEGKIEASWQNGVQDFVASAVSQFNPRELTDRRADVETAVYNGTIAYWNEHNIPVKRVGLKDWGFASKEASDKYDQALLSQTQIDIANNEQQAAKIRADTQVIIAKKLAEGQRAACDAMHLVSETNCIAYLQLIWLSNGANPSSVTVVTGSNLPVAISPNPAPAPATPVPAATQQP